VDDDDGTEPPGPGEVDGLLRNNGEIEACFQAARDAGVVLETVIRLSLVIEPDGTVSSARITTAAHTGTELDTCISTIVLELTFTPWDGNAVTLNYLFLPNA
jgi:hypothetical protein